ncbi:alpha/beta hydrolase family protein [Micromonospora sp. NBC_01655]|uniref:alpha/beta hydrolase n=1 Tax=Micromonospora sp. NBC_01655 TaxID=2975983 RepID=UPI002250D104|nr:alpha/beta hydrolase [Micromonospora sp. NBC_01655]MCX4470014.1 alpha/beta hydrolase family protein [Micromonospora sp. NBC_01655]
MSASERHAGTPGASAGIGGYARLWAADPAGWAAAGTAWRGLTGLVDRRSAELAGAAGALRAGWTGAAAGAASGRIAAFRADLAALAPAVIEADQVLTELAGRLSRARAGLAEAVALAEAGGVRIDRRGRVSADPAGARPGAPAPPVARVAAAVTAALALADGADREAAGRLDELTAAARAGWVAPPPPWRPAPGADPSTVRSWWAGLTPAQRRWLVAREPDLVGRLDGVPAAARDQANRLLVDRRREVLLAERRRLLGRWPLGPVETAGLARVGATLAGLDALTARLAGGGQPRAYLLGLDPGGEGRAIVALGDPDRADRVLTYVPGMTAGLADATGELGRAGRVQARCTALDPTGATAAVLWLDYDAPDFLHEAVLPDQARDAGPALHRFQEGLRATHDGPPARQTVLGHSYGSLVVGGAARDHGLAADALVFVGSPGVGVDRADGLRLPSGEVWASTAPDDAIRLAPAPDELPRRVLRGLSPLAAVLTARDDHELWFGHDPADPGFGGRTFPSGRYGHTGYWEHGNPALDGMARVVLGR